MKALTTVFLFFMVAFLSPCRAQNSGGIVPDFKAYFEAMRESRAEYNRYSDSLFLVKNKSEWINLVKRRSARTQQLYQIYLQRKKDIYACCRNYQGEIPIQAFADLFDYYHTQTYAKQDLDNPLTLMAVCKVFDYGGKRVVDSLKCINVLNTWKLYGYLKLWNLGGNKEYLSKAYECGKFILSDEARKYPYHDYALSQAFRYMPRTMWIVNKVGTVAEYREFCGKLDEFLARPDIHEVVSQELYTRLHYIQDTADESLVRNTYLAGDTVIGKEEAHKMMEAIINRNLSSPNVSCLSYIRMQLMLYEMGRISVNQAREECLRRYRLNWEKIKSKRLSTHELNDYLQPFYTFFYLNYKASVPFEEKRQTVVGMCHDIARVYFNRLDHEGTTDYVRDLLNLSTYDKVTMYLTPEGVGEFLRTMNIASQATTYARSKVSSELAKEIMKDVLKYKPELLVGQLDCKTVDDVKIKSKEFLEFIKEAALYHDIGMNSVASVTKSEFRPMFDEERDIYEHHTKYGLKYLKLTPYLQNFGDIVLGHHKWYNGKGGYPSDFDITKSPVRILIDIVHQSDAVLGLTKKMVGKYAIGGVANAVLEELKAGAGTQYNPDLVNLILEHPNIVKKIRYYAEQGWVNEYYHVFKEHFFDRDY